MASARKRVNKITQIRNETGTWVADQAEVCQVVSSYFNEVFDEGENDNPPVLDHMERRIMAAQNASLLRPFSFDEFTEAVQQMHPNKSLGPDGFNPSFYQKLPLIGKDIFQTCSAW